MSKRLVVLLSKATPGMLTQSSRKWWATLHSKARLYQLWFVILRFSNASPLLHCHLLVTVTDVLVKAPLMSAISTEEPALFQWYLLDAIPLQLREDTTNWEIYLLQHKLTYSNCPHFKIMAQVWFGDYSVPSFYYFFKWWRIHCLRKDWNGLERRLHGLWILIPFQWCTATLNP